MYSVMKKRIVEAQERNRRNMHKTMEAFRRRLEAEANGCRMKPIRYDDIYVMQKDGSLKKIVSANWQDQEF